MTANGLTGITVDYSIKSDHKISKANAYLYFGDDGSRIDSSTRAINPKALSGTIELTYDTLGSKYDVEIEAMDVYGRITSTSKLEFQSPDKVLPVIEKTITSDLHTIKVSATATSAYGRQVDITAELYEDV